ncbi:MAG: nuclear transport factor 2 family protein [Salibacteraceae bacterium]
MAPALDTLGGKRAITDKRSAIVDMDIELCKQNAIDFYKMAYEGDPKRAVELFVGNEYIQHNPDVKDGTEGFIAYFNKMQREYPNKSIEFLRCIAEGDLVALHTHQTWPGNEEYVTMDFFRFDNRGKICEHWDSIQKIPESSANSNSMF